MSIRGGGSNRAEGLEPGTVKVENRDLHDEISDLEERVEELAASLQRCHKAIWVSRLSIVTGGVLLFATIVHLLDFDPLRMILAVTAIIGGIVVVGSTMTTAKQTSASVKEAEARRTELINSLELRNVRDG
jgi:cell division septum initiation protein DivIVA